MQIGIVERFSHLSHVRELESREKCENRSRLRGQIFYRVMCIIECTKIVV